MSRDVGIRRLWKHYIIRKNPVNSEYSAQSGRQNAGFFNGIFCPGIFGAAKLDKPTEKGYYFLRVGVSRDEKSNIKGE
jgi:hypothetical protein